MVITHFFDTVAVSRVDVGECTTPVRQRPTARRRRSSARAHLRGAEEAVVDMAAFREAASRAWHAGCTRKLLPLRAPGGRAASVIAGLHGGALETAMMLHLANH